MQAIELSANASLLRQLGLVLVATPTILLVFTLALAFALAPWSLWLIAGVACVFVVGRHRLRLGLADLMCCFRNPLPSLAITARACTLDQVAAFLGTYLEGGNACL